MFHVEQMDAGHGRGAGALNAAMAGVFMSDELEKSVVTLRAGFGAALDGLEQLLSLASWINKNQDVLALKAWSTDMLSQALSGNISFGAAGKLPPTIEGVGPVTVPGIPAAPQLTLDDLASALARYTQAGLGSALEPWFGRMASGDFDKYPELIDLVYSPPDVVRQSLYDKSLTHSRPRHRSHKSHRTRKAGR